MDCKELLKKVSEIPETLEYNAFGRIYEYFLGEFARTEGQKGGEFFTPSSIVRLIVQILEPYHGRVQTRLAVLVVCSFKARASCMNTERTHRPNCHFTVKNGSALP